MTEHQNSMRFTSKLIRFIGNAIGFLSKENRICIITYHRILNEIDPLLEPEVDVETFKWQMETLAECFNVLSLDDAIAALINGSVPRRAVCISFDDGYSSCHDLALPILTKLGLTATVFVTSGYLDQGSMWNDRIIEAVRHIPEGKFDLQEIGMGIHTAVGYESRKEIIRKINGECKYLSVENRLKAIEKLEQIAGKTSDSNLMLTRKMVKNLASQGIEIGGHTVTHPILTKVNDQVAQYEISENKRELEEIIGKPLKFFAYPNGKAETDFDHRHVKMVSNAGYTAAFTTKFGAVTKTSDFFAMPRARPWDPTPFRFALRLIFWLARTPNKVDHNKLKLTET